MQKELAKLIAFYLPQYHINNLNNELWGDGFTEWTNVAQGRPNFVGHYQPHIPGKLGFYDLSFVETISKQVDLAKSFGIYGFCFYYLIFFLIQISNFPSVFVGPMKTGLKNGMEEITR